MEVGYRTLTKLTSSEYSVKFQITDKQLKFRPNHTR